MIELATIAFVFAAIPAGLCFFNLFAYRVPALPSQDVALPALSVLIPARNEERNIRAAIESVQSNRGANFELIVLDDASSDGTADIVINMARQDARIRLATAPPLPVGWCGKQHACQSLAELAANPILLFMDADVRLSPDALHRMASFLQANEVKLASGVPKQEVQTPAERLLIPLIHFVLLGFLPIHQMRRSSHPRFAAGCGQLFVADKESYFQAGGHRGIANSSHDGLRLPKAFRASGFRTDLFDATPLARCRMYSSASEVWNGLSKNATEGLASGKLIVPMTTVLFAGQILPFLLLGALESATPLVAGLVYGAVFLALVPRFVAAARFQQSYLDALLHPFGIGVLLTIQWTAFVRKRLGAAQTWKGRALVSNNSTSVIQ